MTGAASADSGQGWSQCAPVVEVPPDRSALVRLRGSGGPARSGPRPRPVGAVRDRRLHPLLSPLHDRHLALGAKLGDFGGWSMPLEYAGGGVVAEHTAVRERVGVFDVSHLGKAP